MAGAHEVRGLLAAADALAGQEGAGVAIFGI